MIASIPALFDGIEISHTPQDYPALFEPDARPIGQDIAATTPLTLSKKLEKFGGIYCAPAFSGAYELGDLIAYLESFLSILRPFEKLLTTPIVIALNSIYHCIIISYDFNQKQWLLNGDDVDPFRYFTHSEECAKAIFNEFSAQLDAICILQSELYNLKSEKHFLQTIIARWQQQATWKMIHTVTHHKAHFIDAEKCTWLHIAACIGNETMITELLKFGANAKLLTQDNHTALDLAKMYNHPHILSLLEASLLPPSHPYPPTLFTPLPPKSVPPRPVTSSWQSSKKPRYR